MYVPVERCIFLNYLLSVGMSVCLSCLSSGKLSVMLYNGFSANITHNLCMRPVLQTVTSLLIVCIYLFYFFAAMGAW